MDNPTMTSESPTSYNEPERNLIGSGLVADDPERAASTAPAAHAASTAPAAHAVDTAPEVPVDTKGDSDAVDANKD